MESITLFLPSREQQDPSAWRAEYPAKTTARISDRLPLEVQANAVVTTKKGLGYCS
jgi:hypothetical protein